MLWLGGPPVHLPNGFWPPQYPVLQQTLFPSVTGVLTLPHPDVRWHFLGELISTPSASIPTVGHAGRGHEGRGHLSARMGHLPMGMLRLPHRVVRRCRLGLVLTAYNLPTFVAGMGHLLTGIQTQTHNGRVPPPHL